MTLWTREIWCDWSKSWKTLERPWSYTVGRRHNIRIRGFPETINNDQLNSYPNYHQRAVETLGLRPRCLPNIRIIMKTFIIYNENHKMKHICSSLTLKDFHTNKNDQKNTYHNKCINPQFILFQNISRRARAVWMEERSYSLIWWYKSRHF